MARAEVFAAATLATGAALFAATWPLAGVT
jgi:hypothetical protein